MVQLKQLFKKYFHNMRARHTVEISHKTIIFTVFFLISLYLVFILRDVIFGLFISVLITTALNPAVNRLEKYKIPRPVSILSLYALIITTIILLIGTIVPPLVNQTVQLIQSLPLQDLTSELQLIEVNLESIQIITDQLGSVVPVFKIISTTFSGLITLFTFAVITFYFLMERKNLHKHLVVLFGEDGEEARAEKFVNKVEHKIGSWIRGELVLMFIVGLITYIGLRLLNIPYALALAILAGLLEVIPNIGPTISAVPAIITSLITTQNPVMAIFVTALYILVQQLENNIIVPKVMKSAVGVHPLVTIILIIIGFRLLGIPGAILAVPIFLVIQVIYQEYMSTKKSS
ncbi:AI-2E family transporter [Pseudomonadota bacterium]